MFFFSFFLFAGVLGWRDGLLGGFRYGYVISMIAISFSLIGREGHMDLAMGDFLPFLRV